MLLSAHRWNRLFVRGDVFTSLFTLAMLFAMLSVTIQVGAAKKAFTHTSDISSLSTFSLNESSPVHIYTLADVLLGSGEINCSNSECPTGYNCCCSQDNSKCFCIPESTRCCRLCSKESSEVVYCRDGCECVGCYCPFDCDIPWAAELYWTVILTAIFFAAAFVAGIGYYYRQRRQRNLRRRRRMHSNIMDAFAHDSDNDSLSGLTEDERRRYLESNAVIGVPVPPVFQTTLGTDFEHMNSQGQVAIATVADVESDDDDCSDTEERSGTAVALESDHSHADASDDGEIASPDSKDGDADTSR